MPLTATEDNRPVGEGTAQPVYNVGPGGSTGATAAGQTSGNATLTAINTKIPAQGQALAAGSTPVVLTAIQVAQLLTQPGAVNMVNGQVASGVAAATVVAARATRRYVLITNLDAAINVFLGVTTVTLVNGYRLLPGAQARFDTTLLIQSIAVSGTPTLSFVEFYD